MPRLVRPGGAIGRSVLLATVAVVIAVLVLPPLVVRGASSSATRVDWGVKTPMPTARTTLAVAAAPNGKLYAVGGTNGSPLQTVEEYDPAANSWTTKAPIQARYFLGVAAHPNGRLYAVGGRTNAANLGTVEEYNPATDSWSPKAPMPTPRSRLGLAAAPNGRLYAVGGESDSSVVTSSVEEYDPATDTWRGVAQGVAQLPTPRRGLGLAVAPNGRLYAIGGWSQAALGTVEEYDSATNTWRGQAQGIQSMPTPRENLGLAAAPNGRLYAVGGFTGSAVCSAPGDCSKVEAYDPTTSSWQTAADGLAPLPTPRQALGVATAPNGRLYAIGGQNGAGIQAAVEEYDPAANVWAHKPARSPIILARHRAPAAVANGRIYVFGGENPFGDPLANVQQYDPATDTWESKANMPIPLIGAAAVTAQNGRIYVVSGVDVFNYPYAVLQEFTPPADGVGPGVWRRDPDIAQPTVPRSQPGAALAPNGRIQVVGGSANAVGGSTNRVEEYRPTTDTWREVQAMPSARGGFGFARAGDNKLYAVGGGVNPLESSTLVQRFIPPGGSFDLGTWEGPFATGTVAQLPASRALLGLVGAPSGNLYAIGGYFDTADPAQRYRGEVFEYDPSTNAWTTEAPMPTPRRGMSVAMVGDRIFAIAGFNGVPLTLVEEAVLVTNSLPTVAAGGPYNVPAGANVQLVATGSDPDGNALSYAWDVDGDLVYETAGQNPAASTRGLTPGVRIVRVRALDSAGGYSLATATLTLAPAAKLRFVTQPGSAQAGSALAVQPVVQALDAQDRVVPGFAGPVTLSFGANPGSGALGGTTTVTAVNGVATFAGLSISAAGAGYTLVASTSGVSTATSDPFNVVALPTLCGPRPTVSVQTQRVGPGQIRAVLRAGQGTLAGTLSIGPPGRPIQNATVDVLGGPSGIISSQDVSVSGSEVVLTVTRRGSGAVTVPLTIADGCGDWQTLVGFGPGV